MIKVKEFLSLLCKNKVRFIIIGGQAAVFHGSDYMTADIDFCFSRDNDNLDNIVKAFEPFHPTLRGADKNLPFIFDTKTLKMGLNFTFSTDIGDIDLFGEVAGLGSYIDVLKYSETVMLYNLPCQILTLEGLIIAKKAAGRKKDLKIIEELEAIKEIRKQQDNKT